MKTEKSMLGRDLYKAGFTPYHIWGEQNGVQISEFIASKDPVKAFKKYKGTKVYMNPATTELDRVYEIA